MSATIKLTDDLRDAAETALSYHDQHRNDYSRKMLADALRAIVRADDPESAYAEDEHAGEWHSDALALFPVHRETMRNALDLLAAHLEGYGEPYQGETLARVQSADAALAATVEGESINE